MRSHVQSQFEHRTYTEHRTYSQCYHIWRFLTPTCYQFFLANWPFWLLLKNWPKIGLKPDIISAKAEEAVSRKEGCHVARMAGKD